MATLTFNANAIRSGSLQNQDNAKNGSSSTDYATTSMTSSGTSVYLAFNIPVSQLPNGASISSISCRAKMWYGNGYSSYVDSMAVQMYRGSTAVGSEQSVGIYTLSADGTQISNPGTGWVASNFRNNNASVRFYGKTNSSGVSMQMRIYGATITINYTYSGTTYTITSSSSVGGVSVSPTSATVYPGADQDITITTGSLDGIAVTDNGNDVTSSLVAGTGVYTYSLTDISANHTILVAEANTDKFYFKNGSTWVAAKKVYKKISGVWVEQSDLPSVITGDVHYKRGVIWHEQVGSTLKIYGAHDATQSGTTLTLDSIT